MHFISIYFHEVSNDKESFDTIFVEYIISNNRKIYLWILHFYYEQYIKPNTNEPLCIQTKLYIYAYV